MRLSRCYLQAPLQPGSQVELPETITAHLVRVLRLGLGTRLILFNGDGHDYSAVLTELGKKQGRADILERHRIDNESPLRLTLAQAVARGEKMDWVLQKATELGVNGLVPLFTERTEVRLDAERGARRQAHWQGVITAACEQSGRACLPHLEAPASLADWLAARAGSPDSPPCFYLDPEAADGLHELPDPGHHGACFVIGPEGGLGARDLAQLRAAGARGLRLGRRILRTETAGIAILAAMQALYGDWR